MAGVIAFLNRVFREPSVDGRESAEAYADWDCRMGHGLVVEYLEPWVISRVRKYWISAVVSAVRWRG